MSQSVLRPIRETGSLMEYLKACRDIGSMSHREKLATLETFNVQKAAILELLVSSYRNKLKLCNAKSLSGLCRWQVPDTESFEDLQQCSEMSPFFYPLEDTTHDLLYFLLNILHWWQI